MVIGRNHISLVYSNARIMSLVLLSQKIETNEAEQLEVALPSRVKLIAEHFSSKRWDGSANKHAQINTRDITDLGA